MALLTLRQTRRLVAARHDEGNQEREMKHTNEVAIVTGASRGLGAVIARVLAGRGYNLVLGARDPGPLFEIADALGFAGIRVRTVPGDIASAAVQDSLIAKASAISN